MATGYLNCWGDKQILMAYDARIDQHREATVRLTAGQVFILAIAPSTFMTTFQAKIAWLKFNQITILRLQVLRNLKAVRTESKVKHKVLLV